MTKVKMNARHEYEFLANYKVMQDVFKKKKVDKVCSLFSIESRSFDPSIASSGRKARQVQDAVRPPCPVWRVRTCVC